jgi:ERCC4-type nuclease
MTLLIDRREHPKMKRKVKKYARHLGSGGEQLVSLNWEPKDEEIVLVEETNLEVADYADPEGGLGIERKSDDFMPELRNGNLWLKLRELEQYPLHLLMVDKSLKQLIKDVTPSGADEKTKKDIRSTVLGAVAGAIHRGYPPVFCDDKDLLAELIVRIDLKCHDGKDRRRIEAGRRYATKADHRVGVLQRFPGIGTIKAKKLLEQFDSFGDCLRYLLEIDSIDVEELHDIGLTVRDKKEISELMRADKKTTRKKRRKRKSRRVK